MRINFTKLPWVALVSVFCAVGCVKGQVVTNRAANGGVLGTYLNSLGTKLGFYFTFEYFRSNSLVIPVPEMHVDLPDENDMTNSAVMMSELQRAVPGFKIYRDGRNAKVIHFVDIRLLKIPRYALNRKISLTYSGPLGNGRAGGSLVSALSKQVPEISSISGSPISSLETFDDWYTDVSIKVENQPVRRIITDCLPFRNRTPFLWKAVTDFDRTNYTTSIQFYPPKK
ncbi:MAG TPA: hypothetical protein VG938_19635 [Verrucomicrobiae bacterium]|jgi:hypothetical protein|nr:hypothetical protein [Verrucomicrobiae bacterium]